MTTIDQRTDNEEALTPPEARALVIAFNPATHEAIEVARVARAEFTDESVVGAILEALDMAGDAIGLEELPLWKPQIDLWLWSDKGQRAAMHLPREVIHRVAAANASLDIDPYMCEPGEG
ncbi:hypothetical protein [Stenotrophomonas oahuensis]|uniref:Uncharacterized protein n=1 Tax=Stenotrophomonas oahuensis TaxID=3003271 RepID=A0ABY9YQM5_9GAMM|nr:hypothetical protein [Stenotrophomonas sp. A5586]WNH53217.1 hypothetical protein PDM29_02775 [Stenotrophomonas sp. A5586]